MKDLGIFVDDRLTFNCHINNIYRLQGHLLPSVRFGALRSGASGVNKPKEQFLRAPYTRFIDRALK